MAKKSEGEGVAAVSAPVEVRGGAFRDAQGDAQGEARGTGASAPPRQRPGGGRSATADSTRVSRRRPLTTYFAEIDSAHCKLELFDASCRRFYRARLLDALPRHSVELHAYALLSDHAQLLVSAPSRWPIERLLAQVQQAYLSYYNQRFRRRHRCTRVRSALCELRGDTLVRACYRAIERRPLELGESQWLGDSEWSSYPANAFGRAGGRLARHDCLRGLAPDARGSLSRYREFLAENEEPLCARLLATALHEREALDESDSTLSPLLRATRSSLG